jgi:hypothetical protein
MAQVPILDRLVLDTLPLWGEVPILEIDLGASYGIISEDVIVVHSFYYERRTAWESSFKFKALVDLRVGFILLVAVSLIVDLATAGDDEVWIRFGTVVTRGQIECRYKVQPNQALLLGEQHLRQELLRVKVGKVLRYSEMAHSKSIHLEFKLASAFTGL